MQLCTLLLQNSDSSAALDVLGVDNSDMQAVSAWPRMSSLAKLAAGSKENVGSILKMQEAVYLVPWDDKNWLGLAYAETQRGTNV